LDADLIALLGALGTSVTSVWTSLAASSGGVVIACAAAFTIIGFAIGGLWRLVSRKGGRRR